MSSEGMPQEKPFAEQPLVGLTRLVLRFPILTLVVGGALALGATLYSNYRLGFQTNRLDLVNPNSEFNRLWNDFVKEFGDQEDDVVVVVEGADPQKVLAAREDLAAAIVREKRFFHSVLSRIDPSKLKSKGLYYAPRETLQQIEGFLDQVEPIVRDNWAWLNVGNMAREMVSEWGRAAAQGHALPAESQAQVSRFFDSLEAALAGRYQSPWPAEESLSAPIAEHEESGQLLAKQGRMAMILLRLVYDDQEGDFVRGRSAIEALRRLIARTQTAHPETKIGATGLPVIEHDEMASSQTSMTQVSLVSLVGVSLLFVAGFGGWRHPLLAMISLTVGTAWAMGYITLAIGHLNILSSAFAVILIGQGIDFSMYYVAQYLQLRSSIRSSKEALVQTVATVGPGVATGAITTAVAFFMAGLTEFTGVAELGIIAGGGIILCWIAGLTVLPAMIHLADTKWPHRHSPLPVDVRSWLEPLFARPRLLLAATSAVCVLLACGLGRLGYDHNLLHLQARGIESVDLEQRLLSETDQNASFALSVADTRQEVLARKERFLRLPSVRQVEEIASRFPDEIGQKRPIIEAIEERLAGLPDRAPQIPACNPQDLAQLAAQARSLAAGGPEAAELSRRIARLGGLLEQLSPGEVSARLSAFQQRTAEELLALLHGLRAVANPEPPHLADLPESLVSRFVSPSGRYLLKVYSKGDIWDMPTMSRFVREVRSVDPRVTGNPLQVYEASLQMQRSYEEAAIYALLIIVPVVFLDFRTVRHTVLALLPLGLGMVLLFGLLGWLEIPLNAANMIVLPLILGIGIDAGVHVVHDFCAQRGRYRISASTASAVVVNTVTNMAGFGSLMIASHRGLQSLGRVLTLGLTTCLFTSLVMLPALLGLIARGRRASEDQQGTESLDGPQEGPEAETLATQPAPRQRIYRRRPDDGLDAFGAASPEDAEARSPASRAA